MFILPFVAGNRHEGKRVHFVSVSSALCSVSSALCSVHRVDCVRSVHKLHA
jgi:hypothetical protein